MTVTVYVIVIIMGMRRIGVIIVRMPMLLMRLLAVRMIMLRFIMSVRMVVLIGVGMILSQHCSALLVGRRANEFVRHLVNIVAYAARLAAYVTMRA